MFDALDRTIRQLLETELNGDAQEIAISFSQPTGEWAGREGNKSAVNLFLYDVRENPTLRRHQWQQDLERSNGNGRSAPTTLKRTPLMLDCFYLVTAWSGADEYERAFQEHRLLGRTLIALAQYPVLNPPFRARAKAEVLDGVVSGQAAANQTILIEEPAAGHKIPVADAQRRAWLGDPALNPLSRIEVEVRTRLAAHDVLTNPAEVWSALENQMKAGFSYVVTLPIDPWSTVTAEIVTEGVFRFDSASMAVDNAGLERIDLKSADQTLRAIGGLLVDNDGRPHGNVALRLARGRLADFPNAHNAKFSAGMFVESAQNDRTFTKTNEHGEYRFTGLPAGEYVLFVQVSDEKIRSVELTVSTVNRHSYDFTI